MSADLNSVDESLKKHLPEDEYAEVRRILYGKPTTDIPIPEAVAKIANEKDFEVQAFKLSTGVKEHLRPERKVRIALIQNKFPVATNLPVGEQRDAVHTRICEIMEAGAGLGMNLKSLIKSYIVDPFFESSE